MAARRRCMPGHACAVGRVCLHGCAVGAAFVVACVVACGSPALAAAPTPGVAGTWAVSVTGLIQTVTSDTYTFVRRGKSDTYDVTNESAFRAVASIPPSGGSVTLDFWGGKTLGTGDHFAEHLKFNLVSCPHRFTGTYSETFSDGTPGYHGALKGVRSGACRQTQPDGLDWTMPARLESEVKSWNSEGLPSHSEVHPSKWHADLFLTLGKKPFGPCPSNVKWEWTVEAPRGAKILHAPKAGCRTSMDVSNLGSYGVRATMYKRERGSFRKTSTFVHHAVVVKDWLLVGLGDSNGSGEGNPPFAFPQCNRSLASYQFRAAKYVEDNDPRSSVTFVFASCSGAIIEDLYKTKYVGINPGRPLDPQIEQAAFTIKPLPSDPARFERRVDGAIVSIGVNNLGFGPLLAFCVANFSPTTSCQARTVVPVFNASGGIDEFTLSSAPGARSLQAWIEALVARLPSRYTSLAGALSAPLRSSGGGALGVSPSHVVITQYPDFTRGTDGQPCNGLIGEQDTWGFVGLEAANLNAAVAAAAGAHHWKVALVPQDKFTGPPVGHGYCADDPYFVTLRAALAAGNKPGAFHPNHLGHAITADSAIVQLCRALYGNTTCDGEPPA
jgi:hypothetical protein